MNPIESGCDTRRYIVSLNVLQPMERDMKFKLVKMIALTLTPALLWAQEAVEIYEEGPSVYSYIVGFILAAGAIYGVYYVIQRKKKAKTGAGRYGGGRSGRDTSQK